ncbi:Disease resistance family protein / LRR family protein [Hibiscus syriacus]|uniref:Disease resistance family protein / LRR family protein n=1 Tax=Hibiscus syriacus TaxID=106335 RepID=A0A6A3C1R0_HIBSY|nr:Disease resistance family protein / LRR family protein [Hibiscus syriacus]
MAASSPAVTKSISETTSISTKSTPIATAATAVSLPPPFQRMDTPPKTQRVLISPNVFSAATLPAPDKSKTSSTPSSDQKSTQSSSQVTSLRVPSYRQLSNAFAQFDNLLDAIALNEWRFSKLKEFKDRNIEIENNAFDRYMQNISLLEEVFSTETVDEGSELSPTSQEGETLVMTSGMKLRLRLNPVRTNNARKRIQQIVDQGIQKLQKSEPNDGSTDPNDQNKLDNMLKREKSLWVERSSRLSNIVNKLNKARNEEDIESCLEMKAQLYNQTTMSTPTEIKDVEALNEQGPKNNATPGQEIVKGYGRKFISPRCALKIDLQKAFDSINWDFIYAVLKALDLPSKFIDWIVSCFTDARYSIALNGSLVGLKLNAGKCDIFTAGISAHNLDSIINYTGFKQGRAELIKTVLFSVANYWCRQLVLPQSIIKKFEQLCSRFFWKGSDTSAVGARVSWVKICKPKSEGGLGLKDIKSWNNACLIFLIRKLLVREGSLWIAWLHNYIIRQHDFWTMEEPQTASWSFKRMLKLRNVAQIVRVTAVKNTKKIWEEIRPRDIKVAWHKLVWYPLHVPKHSIISWMVILDRLPTKDRMQRLDNSQTGLICWNGLPLHGKDNLNPIRRPLEMRESKWVVPSHMSQSVSQLARLTVYVTNLDTPASAKKAVYMMSLSVIKSMFCGVHPLNKFAIVRFYNNVSEALFQVICKSSRIPQSSA